MQTPNTPGVVVFALAPPRSRRPTGRNKKKHFAHPGTTAKKNLETNDTGHEQKGATTNNNEKPTHSLRPWTATLTHFFSGATFPAGPAGVFFFAAALRGRSLTHCGSGRRCLPPGWCFLFCCGPARTGVVFFVLLWPRPDAHSLTVGWGDFGKARVVFLFFLF